MKPSTYRSALSYIAHPKWGRPGFTLAELLISMAIFSTLAIGLTSVLMISTRAVLLPESPVAKNSESARVLSLIRSDLIHSRRILRREATLIEFEVDDRDGDQQYDQVTIEYDAVNERVVKSIYYSASATTVAETLAFGVDAFSLTPIELEIPVLDPQQLVMGEQELLYSRDETITSLQPADLGGADLGGGLFGAEPNALNKTVLLVVQSSSGLLPRDLQLMAMLDTAGLDVNLIDQSATVSTFQSMSNDVDLAYVSSTVNVSRVGEILRDLSIGVVNESLPVAESLGIISGGTDGTNAFEYLQLEDETNVLAAEASAGFNKLFKLSQDVLTKVDSDAAADFSLLSDEPANVIWGTLQTGDQLAYSSFNGSGEFGFPTEFPTVSVTAHRVELATKATLTERGLASTVSLFMRNSSYSFIRMGIYEDNGGVPGRLIAETSSEGLAIETVSRWVSSDLLVPVELPPGDYWIAASVFGAVKFHYETGGATSIATAGNYPWEGMTEPWTEAIGYATSISAKVEYLKDSVAMGRRVQLPWSGTTADLSELTNWGVSVFERSLQWAATTPAESSASVIAVNSNQSLCQLIMPEFESTDEKWTMDRIAVRLKSSGGVALKKVRFTLSEASDLGLPTTTILGQTQWIDAATLPSDDFDWYTIPFSVDSNLPTSGGVCLTIESDSPANTIEIVGDETEEISERVLVSTDGGTTWLPSAGMETLRIYLFGRTGRVE